MDKQIKQKLGTLHEMIADFQKTIKYFLKESLKDKKEKLTEEQVYHIGVYQTLDSIHKAMHEKKADIRDFKYTKTRVKEVANEVQTLESTPQLLDMLIELFKSVLEEDNETESNKD